MEYYNFLTTPSGKYCELRDILNKDYITIVKFIESENYAGFFGLIDEIASSNIPDFKNFNLIEKCYVYMAMCMYSIKSVISINNPKIGEQVVSLGTIINNIEDCYVEKEFNYKLNNAVELTFGFPKSFTIEDKLPIIDWFSGLKKFNGKDVSNDQIEKLKSVLKAKDIMSIEDEARENLYVECDLFKGIPMNEMKVGLCSESLIINTLFFFKYPLEGLYAEMYSCCKHLKMSFSDFMRTTHIETEIFLSFAKKENEEYNKKDKNGVGTLQRAIADQ